MKHEFVVWTDRTRLPTVADIAEGLKTDGYECQIGQVQTAKNDASAWAELDVESNSTDAGLTCHVVTSVPSADEINQLRESYELLPYQVKNAARKYSVSSERDDYGQATPFHMQVVATLARLCKGVIDDPQEGGLMMLQEFQDYMSA